MSGVAVEVFPRECGSEMISTYCSQLLNYSTDRMCVRVYEYIEFCFGVEKRDIRVRVGFVEVCVRARLR